MECISNSVDSNQMVIQGDAIGSMESIEHPDADSEDGFYEVLHNIFPSSSPHSINCSNSAENISFQSQMADLGEPSSSHENLEFFSGTEEIEDPVDTSLQKESSSSKKIQSCSMKSVAIQCEPITYVSKGVQWEPLLMVSQSVQCMPLTQVVQEVQCSNTFKTQFEQSETVSLATIGVQYEYPCAEEETDEKHSNTSKQLPENVPLEESKGVDCESDIHSTSQQCRSEDQQVLSILTDLSITLPSLQGELDVVNSSQTTVCVKSSSSQGSDVSFPEEDEHAVELNGSQPIPSTSGVKCKRKRKRANRVRKMKRSIKTEMNSSSSEGTHAKCSKKRLPLKTRTDRNRSLTECVNSDDSDKIESDSVQEKEANNVRKELCSPSKETSTSGKSGGEKLVVEESPEELLEQMGNYDNCLAKEDISNKKNGALEISIKHKQLQTASQKINNSSCPQSNTTRDVAVTSESQRMGGLNWFSSLACERFSSPESIGEDMFEELKEDRSNCNKNLAPKVQSKFTKIVDEHFSFHNNEHSHRRESCAVRKSVVQNLENDSCKSPERRKKLEFDANNTNTSVSSKCSAQLVPYSDSDSGSESFSVHHFNESNQEGSKKILKKQQHCKTTPTNKLQMTGIIPSEPWKQKTRKTISCDRESKSQFQSSLSNSENSSEKKRPAHAVVSTSREEISESENSGESEHVSRSRIRRVQRKKINILASTSSSESIESENSGESDIVSRKKIRRIQENNLNVSAQQNPGTRTRSGNVHVHSPEVGNKHAISQRDSRKPSPVHISIWSSDEEGNCSRASTVTCRSTASKGFHRRGAPYVKAEREAILWHIIDHKYYKLVRGKAMWERMEKEQVCIDRTWQSMKEHFIKKILPQIETFNLSPEITKRFVNVRK